jgi:hypothetical protein
MEGAVRSGLNAVIALSGETSSQGTKGHISELAESTGTEVNKAEVKIEADEREVRS